MSNTKYKAIIFDLGQVIININFEKSLEYWALKSNLSKGDLVNKFQFDSAYEKHERNEITGQDYFSHLSQTLGLKLTYKEFVEGWNAMIGTIIPETMSFIERYQNKLSFFVLTNSNVIHREVWSKMYKNELSKIDQVFCSSQIQTRKPEATSYQKVLKEAGFLPQETIFVDDREDNIEGAQNLGITGLLFTDPQPSIEKLEALIL